MSDYFLNKIYDSLLVNKQPKTKSTFRTLSESYDLIYEEEVKVQTAPLSGQNNLINKQPTVQQSTNNIEPKPLTFNNKTTVSGFNTTQIVNQAWTQEQKNLYNIKPQGVEVGPGELSVASVLLGTTDEQECAKLVSGPSMSYDVSYPNKDNPDVIFEVKQLLPDSKDSVRIARHGAFYAKNIAADVASILDEIIHEYELLDNENKQIVNNYIISQIKEEKDVLEPKKADRRGKDRTTTKAYQQELNRYENWKQKLFQKEQWSVDRWAYGIKNNAVEIPFSLLFSDNPIDIAREGFDDEQTETLVESSLFISIKKFLDLIDQLDEGDIKEFETAQSQEIAPKINALNKVFKDYYSSPGTPEEKQAALNKEFEKAAYETDKKLTKLKIGVTGSEQKQTSYFVNKIKSLNLIGKLKALETKTNDPKMIRTLFPKGDIFGGLFIVNVNGFHYVPADKLHEVIQVEQISVSRPKIGFKRKQ